MKTYEIAFSPEALVQLADLYHYAASAASPEVAAGYVDSIVAYCEALNTFPMRGTSRDDIRPGLRVSNYRKRAIIAFSVLEASVTIIGIFYGGQNYEIALQDEAS